MPHVVWSARARNHLSRLHAFLAPKSVVAADRAIETIKKAARRLEIFPAAGREAPELGEGVRELPVLFSSSGYLLRYVVLDDVVVIAAVKHMREQRPERIP